jgi:hypothetical protein
MNRCNELAKKRKKKEKIVFYLKIQHKYLRGGAVKSVVTPIR